MGQRTQRVLQAPARASQRMGFEVKRAEVEEDVESVRRGAARAGYWVTGLLCWRACLSVHLPQSLGGNWVPCYYLQHTPSSSLVGASRLRHCLVGELRQHVCYCIQKLLLLCVEVVGKHLWCLPNVRAAP